MMMHVDGVLLNMRSESTGVEVESFTVSSY